MTSLKTSIKTITYLSDIGCLEIQGASLIRQITQSSIIPACTDYIEAKNAEVHGAYGSARH